MPTSAATPLGQIDTDGQIPLWLIGAAIGAGGSLVYQLYDNSGQLSCVDWLQALEWGALGAGGGGTIQLLGRAVGWTWRGGEIVLGPNFRFNPFGNWSNPRSWQERLPHYHRRGGPGPDGETPPGQGVGRHRPWQRGQDHDQSFWDRF